MQKQLAVCAIIIFLAVNSDLLRAAPPGKILPGSLLCELRINPLGIDVAKPEFEYTVSAMSQADRGLYQTAYQIIVSSSPELLQNNTGDLWNSGKVFSSKTTGIAYRGTPLQSHQVVWWKIRVWEGTRDVSPWSNAAHFTMGVLSKQGWANATWIGAPEKLDSIVNSTILLRREFTVKPGLKRAVISICGLGQYEMTLNGKPLTETLLNPGWTQYDKTCLYDTYDITAWLQKGDNAIGLLLSNGMYRVKKGGRYAKFEHAFGRLQAIAKITFEYNDGSVSTLVTDEKWKAGSSPMTWSSIYGGEDWDARKVETGWDKPGFNASAWLPVETMNGPGGQLKGITHAAPPIRTFQKYKPISSKEVKPGVTVYDLGQQASFISTFTTTGPAGSVIKITPTELLNEDGTIFRNNYNGKSYSQYTLAGTGIETYTSRFFTTGCRYYQVECLPAPGSAVLPKLDAIAGIVVHSDNPFTGEFRCSNELFNRTFKMIQWAEISNMKSVISDCPHRERLGWLEQSHLHGPSFRYNYDMRALYKKIMYDMNDTRQPNGLVPCIAPELTQFGPDWREAIEWGTASVLIPWQQYEWTGDTAVLRQNYAMMKGYVEYLTGRATNGIAAEGKGDWSGRRASPHTPKELIATAFYYNNVFVLAKAATMIGKTDEAATYKTLATEIRLAFNQKFFNKETKQYGTGSQCANAMVLVMGLVDSSDRKAVLNNIVTDIESRKYENTTGEVGMRYLINALADGGRSDVVYRMNNQSELPGYGYQLKAGATALAETWDAWRDNSQNQFMLGHIMEWFYQHLAGIQMSAAKPGFGDFIIKPNILPGLTEVQGSYHSIHGQIRSGWKRVGDELTMYVVVPPNTAATIFIPAKNSAAITESGNPVTQLKGGKRISENKTHTIVIVGSGNYIFTSSLPSK